MARAILHRIFGLFALLSVGFLSTVPANAVRGERITLPAESFNTAKPERASIQSRSSIKSVCVHVTQRTHESCPACSTSLIMTIVSRVRAKAPGPRRTTDDFSFLNVPASVAAGREAAHPSTIYGSLSQASTMMGTSIFARTGRLRI